MYTIFDLASGWRRFGGPVSEARNQDHDDREWSAIVGRFCAVSALPEREPLVMRILHCTSHAAAFTVPPLSARAAGSPVSRRNRAASPQQAVVLDGSLRLSARPRGSVDQPVQ
jgi:hypothetical protein